MRKPQWCPRLAVLSPIGRISYDTYVVFGESVFWLRLEGWEALFLAVPGPLQRK
jgi:hypothetical protein